MTVSARLRDLADKATPGPWLCIPLDDRSAFEIVRHPEDELYIVMLDANDEDDARLIALAPELARWAADAADVLAEYDAQCECGTCDKNAALLSRLAGIVGEGERA